MTMVYSIHGVYKPSYNWAAPKLVALSGIIQRLIEVKNLAPSRKICDFGCGSNIGITENLRIVMDPNLVKVTGGLGFQFPN